MTDLSDNEQELACELRKRSGALMDSTQKLQSVAHHQMCVLLKKTYSSRLHDIIKESAELENSIGSIYSLLEYPSKPMFNLLDTNLAGFEEQIKEMEEQHDKLCVIYAKTMIEAHAEKSSTDDIDMNTLSKNNENDAVYQMTVELQYH
jgi:hypothetical protein